MHYEWNLEKSGKDKYQSDMAGFVEKFKQFRSIINLQIGKETAKNLIDNKSQDFVEIAQTWETDKLICELYLIYSDKSESNGFISIVPTHRIRCDITYK